MVKRVATSSSEDKDDVSVDHELCQEMSDGSLHLSDTSDDDFLEQPERTFKIPSNVRQIKLHMQKERENINLSDIEMKYLKWYGDDKYDWKTNEEVEMIKPHFIFYGPIKTLTFKPFVIG